MKTVEETLAVLGLPVRDKVTGFDGVITSVSFDLYGCIQVVKTPLMLVGSTLNDWISSLQLRL